MFGSKEEEKKLIGASDKMAVAQKMREAAAEARDGMGAADGVGSQTILIAIVFMLSVIFAFLLTDGDLIASSGPGWHPTGVDRIDAFLAGKDMMKFVGDADIDKLIFVFGRGFAFFALTGLLPLLSFLSVKAIGEHRLHPLVASWMISAAALLVYGLFGDSFVSLLRSIAG